MKAIPVHLSGASVKVMTLSGTRYLSATALMIYTISLTTPLCLLNWKKLPLEQHASNWTSLPLISGKRRTKRLSIGTITKGDARELPQTN